MDDISFVYRADKYQQKYEALMKRNSLCIKSPVQVGGGAIRKGWDFQTYRDRNRAGKDTINEHLHLAIVDYHKFLTQVHMYTDAPKPTTLKQLKQSAQSIQEHFGKARDYMVNYYLDLYSMNSTRKEGVRLHMTNSKVNKLYKLSKISTLRPVKNNLSNSSDVNHQITTVNRVFTLFKKMVEHMSAAK